ncbi:MAG: glycosyltransferase family A protein [Pseudomonadota bacterium]
MTIALDKNKVAIVIAVFNDEANIERAIRSAAAQRLPTSFSLDVVVVDDCSTDDTARVARQVCAEFDCASFLQAPENGGPSKARNIALGHTDAEWYLPLDSDDIMDSDRVSKMIEIATHESVDIVADNLLITQADTPLEVDRVLWPEKPEGIVPMNAAYFVEHSYDMPQERSELGFLKPLISRKKLDSPEAPYLSELRFAEDYELYTRLLLDGASAVLVEPCGYYFIQRPHSSSRSQAGDEHKKVATIDQTFLNRKDLSKSERAAIAGHLDYSRKEWGVWTLLEGARQRDLQKILSAFFISRATLGFAIRTAVNKLLPSRAR